MTKYRRVTESMPRLLMTALIVFAMSYYVAWGACNEGCREVEWEGLLVAKGQPSCYHYIVVPVARTDHVWSPNTVAPKSYHECYDQLSMIDVKRGCEECHELCDISLIPQEVESVPETYCTATVTEIMYCDCSDDG